MNNAADKIIAANKANLEAFEGAATKAFAGVEKLVELNLAASKAAMGESFGYAQAVMAVKTPQEFMTVQTGFFQPLGEQQRGGRVAFRRLEYEGVAGGHRALQGRIRCL